MGYFTDQILISLFDLCPLTHHVIFLPSRNSGGDCYQSPWLIVLHPVDNLSKITVQWRAKNLHSPSGGGGGGSISLAVG